MVQQAVQKRIDSAGLILLMKTAQFQKGIIIQFPYDGKAIA
jgi:hypothetical protein